ncbi:MAG: hypothetical protein ABIG29_01940 [Candidatus Nealsonbacteria bacterium]
MEVAVVVYYVNILWDIIKNWWWVLFPFVLWRPFLFWYLWWRQEVWMFAQKSVLLEIKMPKDILKPLRAMEQAFSAMWGSVFDPADWWEKWFEGKTLLTMQLEIVSLGGEPHFYIRVHESRRNGIESAIYSQYPDAEISVADDYTKSVPQNMPNKDWDLWGTDYKLKEPEVFPIKTYTAFFEEKEAAKEEKRIDPLSTLLEGLGTFKPGEQMWIQMTVKPIISSVKPEEGGKDFVKAGRAIADKLAKRTEKAQPKSILQEAADELISGTMPGGKKEEQQLFPAEMRMTPGEKDIVQGVENKVAKRCFDSYIRFVYVAKRDVYFGGAKAIPFGFFNQFSTENLNQIIPWAKTITKVHRYPILDLVRNRRVFVKKRRLFFRYIKRFPPLFPKPGGVFLLNTEEIATMFHFPGRGVSAAPSVSRVESKRGEAPPGLPFEEE